MINRVVLVGRLTKDPELKTTPAGVSVATFTIAVNRTYMNSQGAREADFIPVVTWRRQAETVSQYLRKGSLAGIDGRMQVRHYEGQDGRRIYVTEVVADSVQFLETRSSGGNQGGFQAPLPEEPIFPKDDYSDQNSNYMNDPFAENSPKIDISEDDLPF